MNTKKVVRKEEVVKKEGNKEKDKEFEIIVREGNGDLILQLPFKANVCIGVVEKWVDDEGWTHRNVLFSNFTDTKSKAIEHLTHENNEDI